jgi:response regulator RpfG family c-di-GMP phosphodiesterase
VSGTPALQGVVVSPTEVATELRLTMKVLCVENYPTYLNKLRCVLHKAGNEVIESASPEKAVSLFVEHPVDGALLEGDVPKKNGVSVYRAMKWITLEVPTSMLSGVGPKQSLLLRFLDAYLRGRRASPALASDDAPT